MNTQDRKLQTSEKIFRRLMCLYPPDFRSRFGLEMLQTFRDRCREMMRRGARWGLTLLWVETLLDLAVTAPIEHLERRNLMKALADDFSWDIRHVLTILLKCIGWVLGGIAAVSLVAWLICAIRAWHKEPSVVRAWEQAAGMPPDLQFQFLLRDHPKAESNGTARELERIARQLGVVSVAIPSAKTSKPELGQNEAINSLLASHYIDQQIRTSHDHLDPAPGEIKDYLQKHSAELKGLYQLLNNNPLPHWETDVALRLDAPVPNLQYFRQLQDIIAIDALNNTWLGENDEAQDAVNASWRISQSILGRPELISQLIGVALLKVETGVLRKAGSVSIEWQDRMNLDLRQSILNSLKLDAVVVFQSLRNHEGKILSGSAGVEWYGHYLGYLGGPLFHLWALQTLEAMRGSLMDLGSADFCGFDPDQALRQHRDSISDLGEGKNYVPNGYRAWKSATRATAEMELTREVLKVKSVIKSKGAKADLQKLASADSALCPHMKWDHIFETDGSITIKANRLPAWLVVEEKYGLPLSYTVGR